MLLSKNSVNHPEANSTDVFHDEATHKKILRHLSDKNDIISEEDIKNVRTNFPHHNSPEEATNNYADKNDEKEPLENETNPGRQNNNTDQHTETPVPTPWNILDA